VFLLSFFLQFQNEIIANNLAVYCIGGKQKKKEAQKETTKERNKTA
jgi:hypothetical protein